MIDKIVESGLKTFYKEVCLLEQPYVHDDKKTVAQALKEAEGKVGGADQDRRVRALRARRGHRKAGKRFRRRGRGRRRTELMAAPRMMPKSGNRFSEKILRNNEDRDV